MLDTQERVDAIRHLVVDPVFESEDMGRVNWIHDDSKSKVYFEPMRLNMMFEFFPLFFDVEMLPYLDEWVGDPSKKTIEYWH